ncbi:hypothetical protein EVAR_53497_1 [Eumeta japonica]|uniref:Uncharacterized protein n=1 Tax=Eumeta variegata TaxID=151549 RepID=A0A4C1Y666_EUMVA|nr:hypothetical protein EVAR_53497_1 [Eumeta japonica]
MPLVTTGAADFTSYFSERGGYEVLRIHPAPREDPTLEVHIRQEKIHRLPHLLQRNSVFAMPVPAGSQSERNIQKWSTMCYKITDDRPTQCQ